MNTRSSSMLMLLAAVTITITTSLLLNLPLITADPPDGSLDTDKAALLDFYHALPSGGTKLDWGTKEKVCEWYGITCTYEQEPKGGGKKGKNPPPEKKPKQSDRVVEVRVGAVGLYGPIAARTISRLDALEVLSLRGNSLYGKLPPDILSIPTLKSLHLQNNLFCGDLPAFPNPSRKLEKVDFSFNSFSGTIPTVFSKTKELQYLNLSYNLFSGNIPPNLDLPESITLYLDHNKLQGPIPPSLHKLKLKEDSFVGNPDLCGKPLDKPCDSYPPEYPPSSTPAYSNKLGDIALVGSSLLLFLLLL